jgi:hypothetical protein
MLDRSTFEVFEKAVKQHPEWVNQKSKLLDDRANRSVLTDALLTARTNHVRVLISSGADVADALKWCERYNFPDGERLIMYVCRDLGVKDGP